MDPTNDQAATGASEPNARTSPHGYEPPSNACRGGPSATPRRRLTAGPLERRLFLIVFIGLLPLALLSFGTLLYNAQSQKSQVLDAAANTMRAVITAVDAELEESLAALDALAASPRLARGDMAAFRNEALELLARRASWANVILDDERAAPLMNARTPLEDLPQQPVDPASIIETGASREPRVTNLVRIESLGVHAFAVRLPVAREGRVYVLAAAISPEVVQAVLERQTIPEGGVVAVFDRNHNVLARSTGFAQWINRPASPSMRELLEQGGTSGWGTTTTLEGSPVYSVYYRSPMSGWIAAVGIPIAALDGPIARSYAVLAGSVLLSAVLGMLASGIVARTITRPMHELASAAQAMGKGRRPSEVRTSLPEIRQAAEALNLAHTEREALLLSERQARLQEREARRHAEHANRAKDEFLAMLGHELRNPLAAIYTAGWLLDPDHVPKETMRQAIAIIQRQTAHLAQMTDDLLDTGRVVMGKIQVERRPLNLADAVRSAIETLRESGRLLKHDLQVTLEPVWIDGDAVRMEQVVVNLLTNAVKYTPPAGRIDLELERQGDEAVLRVRDTGLGIEAELLPHIFDLFVQGSRTLDRSQGGLGVGLTLVRRLAQLHGGEVSATSKGRGKGAELVVRLPAIDAPAEPLPRARAPAAAGPRSIVIVEDNQDVRASLKNLLELNGHSVQEAADGPSGVETIRRVHPDVAIVDIGLPRLDGYGVARSVRTELPDVHLIALTGYGAPDDPRDEPAVFDEYIVKPVDPHVLDRLIAGSSPKPQVS